MQDLLLKNQIVEKPLAGESIPKHAPIVEGEKFKLTADTNPTGGSQLEWVTDPLDTEDELRTVMGNITAMGKWLNGRKDDEFIPSEEVKEGGGEPIPDLRIYPDGDPLVIAPQLTAGMRLSELPKLARYLNSSKKSWAERTFPKLMAGRIAERDQAKVDLGTFYVQDNYMSAAGPAVRKYLKEHRRGRLPAKDIEALVGLAGHLASYIDAGARFVKEGNSKAIAESLMSRTNFAHNFSLLSDDIKATFAGDEGATAFANLVLLVAGKKDDGDEPIFGNTVAQGMAGDRTITNIMLTRRDWLEEIPKGVDLLQHEEKEAARYLGQEAVHKSIGSLDPKKMNAQEQEQKMIAAEFRRLKEWRSVEELAPLAIAAFRLIQQLTSGQKLRYRKQE
jgi:hypothetical protein